MSGKSYRETFESASHDPVWWIRLVAAVAALVSLLSKPLGFDDTASNVAFSVFAALFSLTFFLEAVRGRNVGSDKPMGTVERVISAVVSAFVIIVFVIVLLRSFGIVTW